MTTAADADRATRRAQVVEKLADTVAPIDRVPPVHVAVDGMGGAARALAVDPKVAADVVVGLHDPTWPVIRRMDPVVAGRLGPEVFLAETRAFFAPRAAAWEERFPDDDPAYGAAVAELALRPGQTAWTRAAAPAGPSPTCGRRSARPATSSASTSPPSCWPPPAPKRVNDVTRTMGMALTACTPPAKGSPLFELGADEMEMGVGIHGEPGRRRES
jgi:Dak1 domain